MCQDTSVTILGEFADYQKHLIYLQGKGFAIVSIVFVIYYRKQSYGDCY